MKSKLLVLLFGLLLFVSGIVGVFGFLKGEQIARRTDIKIGKVYLQQAYQAYLDEGRVPESSNPYFEMWRYTNVVKIGISNYQGCIAGRFGKRFGDGALVLTTNRVYLWMVGREPVKVLDQDYEPRFFPPGS